MHVTAEVVVGGRYRLDTQLGVGGTAVVHRAFDLSNGQLVALKRLHAGRREDIVRHFEREYLTLRNLEHPRIVAAYDYGIDDEGPFYTMELLDGGDLHKLAPLDWKRACALARDVCSALSLLHSRRLVYRDLSPRNVRCTTDGTAKLIDFGAMTAVGPSRELIGTPPCFAPEALYSQPLDARTDLYALGATLYFALAGRHAYPARELGLLPDMWRAKPLPPSTLVPGIPEALDRLVSELLNLEPAGRPASAAEVIERLCVIADLPPNEQLAASRAYLLSPTLVGRAQPVALLRNAIARSLRRCGGSVLIKGQAGAGRSRLLDACVLEGQLSGLHVLRADASDAQDGAFGVARALGRQLFAIGPDVAIEAAAPDGPVLMQLFPEHLTPVDATGPIAAEGPPPVAKLHQALRQWFTKVAEKKALLIAVDDVHLIDEQSGALLSVLATQIAEASVVVVATLDLDAPMSPARNVIIKVLSEASTPCFVGGLGVKETEELLSSVFGEVPNVSLVATRLQAITSGKPRDLMRLAQHLVDRGTVRYRNGTWSLPQQVQSADLPASLTQALESRVDRLSAEARSLAQAMAFVPELRLTFEECLLLTEHGDRARLIRNMDELAAAEIVRAVDFKYALAESGWTAVLKKGLDREHELAAHLRVANMCEYRGDRFRFARHLMLGGAEERGLSALVEYARDSQRGTASDPASFYSLLQSLPEDWLACYERALQLCAKYNRPRRDYYEIQSRLAGLVTINFVDRNCASELLALIEQLAADSGLKIYETLDHVKSPGERLATALARAKAAYEATPEVDRVLEPGAAIRELARVVTEALGQIALSNDHAFWKRLPSLAAFAPVSPAFGFIDLLMQGMGARLSGRTERAVHIYREVLERISDPHSGLPPSHRLYTRLRVIGSIGIQVAVMGLPLQDSWAVELSSHPIYAMNALLLRMLHHLWRGDEEQAERIRRDAELMRIQNNPHQVLAGEHLMAELLACAIAEDLTRVKRSIDALQTMERGHVGWAAAAQYARGEYHRIRGDHEAALRELSKSLDLMQPCCHVLWAPACSAYVRALGELGRLHEAREFAESRLALAERESLGFLDSHLRLALARTLSKLGDHQRAASAADGVIERFTAMGTSGLNLAAAYEVRAAIARAAQDMSGYEQFAEHCRLQLPRGSRLLQRARRHDTVAHPDSSVRDEFTTNREAMFLSNFSSQIKECTLPQERAHRAIDMMTAYSGAAGGLLYVRGDNGLVCVSVVGDVTPTDIDPSALIHYLDIECGNEATERVTVGPTFSKLATSSFVPAEQREYVPVLLSHLDERGLAVTGLALFALTSGAQFRRPERLAAEFSGCVARAGEAIPLYV
jgi:hypothetical protein